MRYLRLALTLLALLVAACSDNYRPTDVSGDELRAIELVKPMVDAYFKAHPQKHDPGLSELGISYQVHSDGWWDAGEGGNTDWKPRSGGYCKNEFYVDVTDLESENDNTNEVTVLVDIASRRFVVVPYGADSADASPNPRPTPCIDGSEPISNR